MGDVFMKSIGHKAIVLELDFIRFCVANDGSNYKPLEYLTPSSQPPQLLHVRASPINNQ